MTSEFGNKRPHSEQEFHYYVPTNWVAQISRAITAAITSVVTVAISLVTTILILAVGVWLLYTYLPAKTFNIIMAVILVDIMLGIILRYLVVRRKHGKSSGG